MSEKRGQLRISFGVIFSIFLIVLFLFFAFKIIASFISVDKCAELTTFHISFQKAIDKAQASHSTNQQFKINLDASIDKICFIDLNSSKKGPHQFPDKWNPGDNFFILSRGEGCEQVSNNQFTGLNITKITSSKNPVCFENPGELLIKKTVYSRIVTIE